MFLSRLHTKPFYDVILLTLLIALLFGASLGSRTYSAPSESRYVEIGREMAESGDFVTPRLNYVKYFEKPPLFYWIQAETTRLFGVGPFTSRVPTALFALALCLITYGLGHMLYGRLAGWLGALTLATSLYLFALSRVVLLDVPVSVCISATLTAFLYVANAPAGTKRNVVLYSMYVAAACAVLTKGLIGAVLPGAVVLLWMALTGRWKLLKTLHLVSGTVLFLLISVPWHVLVSLRNPEFAHFYFIHEHFERYLTRVHGRYQPFWFFGVVFIAGLFPWVPFILQALKNGLNGAWRDRKGNGEACFLAIWIGLIFVFFSLSDSKLIPYILPIFPPLAAIIGHYFALIWKGKPVSGYGWGITATILMLALMAVVPSLMLQMLDADSKVTLALAQGGDEVRYLSIACMIAAGILLVTYIQGRAQHVIIALLAIAAVIVQLGDLVAAHYNKDSMETLAQIIRTVDKPGDEVATYGTYYQDLPVYLGRRITIADWKGELEFGAAHEDTSGWMLDAGAFWKRWLKGDHIMFAVMRDETYALLIKGKTPESLHLYALRQDGRNILFLNQQPELPKESPKP